jgi:hypothetical protein
MLLSRGCQADQQLIAAFQPGICKELATTYLYLNYNGLRTFPHAAEVTKRKLAWESASATGKLLTAHRNGSATAGRQGASPILREQPETNLPMFQAY